MSGDEPTEPRPVDDADARSGATDPDAQVHDVHAPEGDGARDADGDAPAAADDTDAGATGDADDGSGATRRRSAAVTAVVAVLMALLGFTLVVQIRSVATDPTFASAREDDLVRILADLDAHESRLRQEIADLEETLRRLTTTEEAQEEALAEAARRADELGILAGILPAEGPGVVVTIHSGDPPVSAALLLDTIQELRGAGAEAIQINDATGRQVRVVASTYLLDHDEGLLVDGQVLRGPYTIIAIGDPQTLQPALSIPGGVVERVQGTGGTVTVQAEPDGVLVSAVRTPVPPRHARPVS